MGPPGVSCRWVLGCLVGSPCRCHRYGGRRAWDSGRSAWLRSGKCCGVAGRRRAADGRRAGGGGPQDGPPVRRRPRRRPVWSGTRGSSRSMTSWSRGGVGGASGPPNGHGAAWEALEARQEQIRGWVAGDGKDAKPLSMVKVHELLARQGCVVPYRTLHRFATERCGFRAEGHHGAGRRRGAGGGVADRLRPPGLPHRPDGRAAAEGPCADLHRGVLAAPVRVVDVLPDPGGGASPGARRRGRSSGACSRC